MKTKFDCNQINKLKSNVCNDNKNHKLPTLVSEKLD